jgi:hypothetical protein
MYYGAVTAGNGILAVTDGEKCKGHSVFFALIKSQDIDVINRVGVIRLQRKRGVPPLFCSFGSISFFNPLQFVSVALKPGRKASTPLSSGNGSISLCGKASDCRSSAVEERVI